MDQPLTNNYSTEQSFSPTPSQDLDDDIMQPPTELPRSSTVVSVADTPEELRRKKIMLVALLINTFTVMCLQFNVSSLLPAFVDEKYPNLNAFQVGCLMSIFPVGFLVTAPLIGAYLEKIGRKNALYLGVVTMTLSTLAFGLASYFDEVLPFYVVSMVARFLQGVASASVNITTPSIVAQEFPNNKSQYLSYCFMALGAGLAIGPVLGSFAYSIMNYVNTFYFFTAYIGVVGMSCVCSIPSRINQSSKSNEGPNPFSSEVGYL
jgi:MFS family permease